MQTVLIDEKILALAVAQNPPVGNRYSPDLLQPPFREPFLRYRVLSEIPHAVRATNEQVLYTRYYWFRVIVELRLVAGGPDAGLDQQAFQLLEGAPHAIDWKVVQQLDRRAHEYAAALLAR